MAVHVEEVETQVREEPADLRRPAAGADAGAGGPAPDPQTTIKLHHAFALMRSRDLRLWAD